MSTVEPSDSVERWRHIPVLLDSEMTTAVLRVVAGVAMLTLHVAGGLEDSTGFNGIVFGLAIAYSIAVFVVVLRRYVQGDDYPLPLTVSLTALDNLIILGLAAISGGVQSLVTGILILVITTDAARFGVRAAVVWAIIDSVVLLGIALFVDEDALPFDERVRLTAWWAWLLIGGAVLAGMIARATSDYRHRLDRVQQQAAIDRLDRELEHQARLEIERADAARRDFLRVIVHELRTPIASMGALSRALSSGGSTLDDGDRTEALSLIESHAEHLSDLLEEVRGLSSSPSVSATVERADADLAHLIQVSASAAGLSSERLDVAITTGARLVRVDAEKVRRILTNLIENAGRHSTDPVRVEASQEGVRLRLRVLDRGSGLSPEVAARAFDKDFSFGTERGSSGLGLWIVRELTTMLGGSVWAEPRDGGGLSVHVELPV